MPSDCTSHYLYPKAPNAAAIYMFKKLQGCTSDVSRTSALTLGFSHSIASARNRRKSHTTNPWATIRRWSIWSVPVQARTWRVYNRQALTQGLVAIGRRWKRLASLISNSFLRRPRKVRAASRDPPNKEDTLSGTWPL